MFLKYRIIILIIQAVKVHHCLHFDLLLFRLFGSICHPHDHSCCRSDRLLAINRDHSYRRFDGSLHGDSVFAIVFGCFSPLDRTEITCELVRGRNDIYHSRYKQFEISPETIEQELRPEVCEQGQTGRFKENYSIDTCHFTEAGCSCTSLDVTTLAIRHALDIGLGVCIMFLSHCSSHTRLVRISGLCLVL